MKRPPDDVSFQGAYGRLKCAFCHKRHQAGTLCPVKTAELRAAVRKVARRPQQRPADTGSQQCRCGCKGPAVFLVKGFEYAPRAPDGKGKPFTELCCRQSADYLTESSAELGFPCTKESLP